MNTCKLLLVQILSICPLSQHALGANSFCFAVCRGGIHSLNCWLLWILVFLHCLMVAVFGKKDLAFQLYTGKQSKQKVILRRFLCKITKQCIFLVAVASLSCKSVSATECLMVCPVFFANPSQGSVSAHLNFASSLPSACLWVSAKLTCQ